MEPDPDRGCESQNLMPSRLLIERLKLSARFCLGRAVHCILQCATVRQEKLVRRGAFPPCTKKSPQRNVRTTVQVLVSRHIQAVCWSPWSRKQMRLGRFEERRSVG